MNDTELFDLSTLCKEVYKRFPKWDDDTLQSWFEDVHPDLSFNRGIFYTFDNNETEYFKRLAPLYTSDYLLGKLPVVTEVHKYTKFYCARFVNLKRLTQEPTVIEADTPLKCLLKLTLALDDAGELPHE